MLTPEQIAALRDAAGQVTDPISDFLVDDIARRIAGAGQLTGTASYQIWRAQQMGLSQKALKKRLRTLLKVSHRDLRRLLTQSAEVGYDFDIKHLPYVQAVPFAQNAALQQTISAAVALAQENFTNLTQTLGMVGPDGVAYPLQEAYRKSMDYAFQQVFTGATDYNTAIRMATKNLADMGVRVIDYASGVHTSLEAAARRNIMGGLGLMQEQISQQNHDALGADGWEISAHAASAPDHEPIQGHQYSDSRYEALNGSLKRRINTLNCGHAALPIILGVSSQQYTPEELAAFRSSNAKGVDYQGKHYTLYEATQKQRQVERSIRTQKRRVLTANATGDTALLETSQIRLRRLNDEYTRFSRGVGLRTQRERAQVAGFGRGQAARATAAFNLAQKRTETVAKQRKVEYNQKRESTLPLIRSEKTPKTLNSGNQNKHITSAPGYIAGRSYLNAGLETAQKLVYQYSGTGEPKFNSKGEWTRKEFVTADHTIGAVVDPETGDETSTRRFSIHYGKAGTHIVPAKEVEPNETI